MLLDIGSYFGYFCIALGSTHFGSYAVHLALNVRHRFTKLLNVVTCLRSFELITTGKAFSIGFYCDCFAGIHCKINGLSANAQAVKIGIFGTWRFEFKFAIFAKYYRIEQVCFQQSNVFEIHCFFGSIFNGSCYFKLIGRITGHKPEKCNSGNKVFVHEK